MNIPKPSSSPMTRLTPEQVQQKLAFIDMYIKSVNAATGSVLDPNANVAEKNIATLSSEIHKDINIQINRGLLYHQIKESFGVELADEYLRQLETHEIYCHDETSLYPYCVSISMYPFLVHGMTKIGGESKAPKHLDSFCGSFINLIFAVASQFAGAVATVEFLMCFDHFARKDYGDDYLVTNKKKIDSALQHVVYSLNQPAAARGFQSVFWNISLFDKDYFNAIFGDFVFPHTYDKPNYDSIVRLQRYFMKWFNKERERSLLTFPVVTAAVLYDEETFELKDEKFCKFLARELSEGNSFFIYESDNPDSLASCCRVRNEFQEAPEFSYSLGAGGVATGSSNVMTLNVNKLVQDHRDLVTELDKLHKYQIAHRQIMEMFLICDMLPIYSAGFIDLKKQYLTIGLSGIAEAAEYDGYTVGNNPEYIGYVQSILKTVYSQNRKCQKETGYRINTEMVPGEGLGVKFANWDKKDGYKVNRDCYNSYFYLVEDAKSDVHDKLTLHGREIVSFLDGGSACHINMEEHLDEDGYYDLLSLAAKVGCNYWTTNVKSTCCEEDGCGYINKQTLNHCIKCGSRNVSHATRIIGYLKKTCSFSEARQTEESDRFYH